MYFEINDRLSLQTSIALETSVGISRPITIPIGHNALCATLIVVSTDGAGLFMAVLLEESNDDLFWAPGPFVILPVAVGAGINVSAGLPGKKYRFRWVFASTEGGASCVLAANAETKHL
jgi:hypothetical protein